MVSSTVSVVFADSVVIEEAQAAVEKAKTRFVCSQKLLRIERIGFLMKVCDLNLISLWTEFDCAVSVPPCRTNIVNESVIRITISGMKFYAICSTPSFGRSMQFVLEIETIL